MESDKIDIELKTIKDILEILSNKDLTLAGVTRAIRFIVDFQKNKIEKTLKDFEENIGQIKELIKIESLKEIEG